MSTGTTLRAFGIAAAIALLAHFALAQYATGPYANGTFDTPGIDTINVGNLNVHLNLQVLNKAGRGIPFTYALTYDSTVWTPVSSEGAESWSPAQEWGWSGSTQSTTGYVTGSWEGVVCSYEEITLGREHEEIPNGWRYTASNVVYYDRWGIPHPFSGSHWFQSSTCGNPTSGGQIGPLAADGSGYQYYSNGDGNTYSYGGTIVDPRGTTFDAPGTSNGTASVVDSNGNEIIVNSSGQFTDTTGNVALTVAQSGSMETFAYTDTNGNSQKVAVTYQPYTVQTNFGCSGVGEFGPVQESLVSSISYPDGSTYSFTYEKTPGAPENVTGRLASIQQPQGGTISYTYTGANNGIECSDGSAAGLTRTINSDSGSAASTITYTRSSPNGGGTSHTEAVDGIGNHKAYDFVEAPAGDTSGISGYYYETKRSIYQGAEAGSPVVALQTCYNQAAAPCTTMAITLPFTQIDTYNTLNGIETDGGETLFNSYGSPTTAYTYDFGASSRGSLLLQAAWYYTGDIATLPTGYATADGAGNTLSNIALGYDGSAAVASSGVPQHAAVQTPRGNITRVEQFANGSTAILTNLTYEDTGSLLTATGPNGTTTLSYDPTFVYTTGASLPTPSSGVAIGAGASYDTTYTGLPLTTIDPNGQTTRITSYDSMLRPTVTNYPDGGETVMTYSPASVTTDSYQSAGMFAQTVTQYDGYGRVSRVAVANGNSWYLQDSCYDANGNLSFQSYRYQAANLSASKVCSGAGTTYTYDVLGRMASAVEADGETRSSTYYSRATQTVDENGVTRISQVDGAGRIAIVCEISSNSSMPGSGSPSSCGTDIAGTGFTTTYAYSANGSTGPVTTTVTQGGQTRIFQTDWLGRPTSITEPESGTTNYSYAYNSTGLAVTRSRPQANQTDSSTLTTTTTQYDSLGRVVSVTYSDGTPAKAFAYDAAASGGWWTGISQANLKGRLSAAWVSSPNAGTAYSYDPMGRVASLYECTPSGCGSSAPYGLQYTYDLAGNLLSSTDGAGVQSTYAVSQAGELVSLASSQNNSTNPPGILSNVQNGPDGPLSWSLGNGLSGVYSYDALGRLNGGWVCSGSTSAYCAGGSQVYGFTSGWSGAQLKQSADTVLNQTSTYGYDQFSRLASRTVTSGAAQNFTWVYDRWGNRWQQNVTAGSGPAPQLSFNTATNQVQGAGFAYDAAGNMTSDSFHGYTYDAEGNIVAVDGGATAAYTYDAMNHRVQAVTAAGETEFVFNANGQRDSEWNGGTGAQLRGHYYWGAAPVAFYTGGQTYFQHQDWLGTERMRTAYNGGVQAAFTSLPFGDAQAAADGADLDPYHYATLDYDAETSTSHAQYRQDNTTQGRWMSPDPYTGSYDFSNPQSFNRYAYVLNMPLSFSDPSGFYCMWDDGTSDDDPADGGDGYSSCMDSGGIWMDTTTITVSGDDDSYNGITTENGYQIYPSTISAPSGGGAPNGGMTAAKFFECASKTANQFSIAGFAGLTSGGGSFGAQAGKAIGTAFLGNTFSNISDMFTHVGTGNFAAAYGDFALGGTAQGLLPGAANASAKGIVGATTDAAVGATLGAEMVEPVGWAKLGIDAIVYLGSMASCIP